MKGIAKGLMIFAAASSLTGCGILNRLSYATETERALCEAWQSNLFLPSRKDTQQTAEDLMIQIAQFRAACPGWTTP